MTSLEHLKVGDKVLVSHGSGFSHHYTIEEIQRETKTQWVVGGSNYRKSDGRKVGGYGYSGCIEELTAEAQANFDEKNESTNHRKVWRDIRDIKQPYHLTSTRLEEILRELTGAKPEEDQ